MGTPLITPGNQALSLAVKSTTAGGSGNTANAQTGQIFSNATEGPYTKANADNIASGGQSTVNPSTITPTTAQNFTPNSVGAFTQQNGNVQAGQQAFQGFRKANTTPAPILPIAQRTNLTPGAPAGTGGNITPIKPIGETAPTTTITPQNFGQSTKQITSTLGATKDDQDFLNQAFTKFTPAQQAEWNAMSQQNKLDSSKTLLQGYRDTRDASLTKENLDYNHDLTVNAKTAQFQADVEQAQRNIATTNQNMALVTGMSGPLRSSDVASATSNAIANSMATYNNLVRSNDYEMAQLSNNYHQATKSLMNAYNDRVSGTTQKLLSNISALDATGEFGTKLGLLKGQDLIDQALNDNLNSQQFLADRMNMMSKIALEQQTMALAQAKIDDSVTKTINDGYAYNSNGTRLKNANGDPIKAQIQMSDQEKLNQQYSQAVKLKQMEIDHEDNTPRIIGTDEYGSPIYGTMSGGAYSPNNTGNNMPNTTTTTNNITNAVDYTKSKEGFQSTPYWDVNGWAIGYGQHAINGVPVKQGDSINEATATADLNNRITNAKFNSLIKTPISESQKAALYSLEHNVGSGVWGFPSGKKIIDQINSGDFQGASNTLANSGIGTTNAATHEVMPGLVNRRKEEAGLLMQGQNRTQGSLEGVTNPMGQFKQFTQPGAQIGSGQKEYTDAQKNTMATIDPTNLTKMDGGLLKSNGLSRNDLIQYKASQKANSWTNGLDPKQVTEANTIANSFYTTPVAQEFNTMQTALGSAKAFQNSKSNSTDQGLINVFAKAMDPGSSVKEGEYTTIQEYSQALTDKLIGKIGRIYSTDGFLTQDAKDKMVDAIQKKLEGNKATYNNLRETYAQRIDSQTRDGVGAKAIPSAELRTVEKPTYTDENGKSYNMQEFKDELASAIKAGKTTPEQAKQWLKDNNITLQ